MPIKWHDFLSLIRERERERFLIFFLNLSHRLTHSMYTVPAKGGMFLPHFTVWTVRHVWKRNREMFILSRVKLHHTPPRHAAPTSCCFCKRSEREKEDYNERHGWGRAGSLPHYPLETTQCWRNLSVAKLFSYWATGYSALSRHVVG